MANSKKSGQSPSKGLQGRMQDVYFEFLPAKEENKNFAKGEVKE
jgi:hypothetical protein